MTGEILRDNGAFKAALNQRNIKSFWDVKATGAMIHFVNSVKKFTSEDIHERAGSPEIPNAMGALFLWASQNNLIKCVGFKKSSRKSAHARSLKVWQSA